MLMMAPWAGPGQPGPRPAPQRSRAMTSPLPPPLPSVSVIVPCKNEMGTVERAAREIPEMGSGTEILFCDDRSDDGTPAAVERAIRSLPGRRIRLVEGPGIDKARNVWAGFGAAGGDIVIVLDGDLTVAPAELPAFYDAIASGTCELAIGSRLTGCIAAGAMPRINRIGNAFFAALVSAMIGRRISDALCGTKALWRRDWPAIRSASEAFAAGDRWGDFSLIFGAAAGRLRISEIPVRYLPRTYGQTKMTGRITQGLGLLRVCLAAQPRLRSGRRAAERR